MRWDVLIPILAYLLATFLVAGYVRRHLRSGRFQEEFFIGGRSLGPLVLAFTMLASAASAGTFIGAPGLAYEIGFAWVLVGLTQIAMGVYILGVLGKKFAIIARKIGAVTVTDFLRERYRSHLVVIGSALGIVIFISAYMVAQFAGAARIVEAITGLPYQTGILIFGVTVVAYTTFGGFRAVAITDAIQGMLMIVGGVVLWIAFMVATDGFPAVASQLAAEQPELLTLPGPGDITPWMLFSYAILFGIAFVGVPHAAVRGMAYRDSRSMHRAIMYSVVIMALFTFFFATLGPVMRVLYPEVSDPDLVLPTFILDTVPGWTAGLILAAPLAAIMSTIDAMLLVASSSIIKDLYLNYVNPEASQRRVSRLSYTVTIAIGVGVVLVALTPPEFLQLIVIFAIGGLEATFVAPIVFGLYWKRATGWGAIASMYTGLISYIVLEQWFPDPFGMNAVVTALTLSITAMVVVSLLTPKPSDSIVRKFWGTGKQNQPRESSPV